MGTTIARFERMPLPRALVLAGWIGGFYAGLKNDTKVDVPAFVNNADHMIALCREHESMRLMALVEQELRRDHKPAHGPRPTAPH
jgi:hypothetical protein